jgi:3-deoxy-D-manno-octulosonic-acid transferase
MRDCISASFRRKKLRPQSILAKPAQAPADSGHLPLALYRGAWGVVAPLAPLLLQRRANAGKEDAKRLKERLGHASAARPRGTLIWIHAASVGESLAALPLVTALLAHPDRHVLVTTGTVTSAQLMSERLPSGVAIHQYAPIDSQAATKRFLDHWRPDLALFIESELWPNLILETRAHGTRMALVNARLSEQSFRGWMRARGLARRLLSCFDECLAQDAAVATRLTALGAESVRITGSLKADAPPLPVNESALAEFMTAIGLRPVFLAASTHPGEDDILLEVVAALRRMRVDALTVIVPRHPHRGSQIEALARARNFAVERRSAGALPSAGTHVYVADTLGELGLFYRTTNFAFLGGSLVPHGGQNPLEAARLHTAVLTGPHTYNFDDIFKLILGAQGEGRVHSVDHLIAMVSTLLSNPIAAVRMAAIAKATAAPLGGALSSTIAIAEKLLGHASA